MKKIFIALSVLTLASCGPNSGTKDGNKTLGKLSYCFPGKDENGNFCSTGIIRFNTFKELCQGLQNENLNSRCAFGTETERRRYFAQNCDGTFTPDNTPMTPPTSEACSEVVVRGDSVQ